MMLVAARALLIAVAVAIGDAIAFPHTIRA
jgi:hypothetical protein